MPDAMLPISPMLQIPDDVWQNIATFLDVKHVGRLRLCSRRLYAMLAAEMARKPLAWGKAHVIVQNLRFWEVNKDLAFHVKILTVSIMPAEGSKLEPTDSDTDSKDVSIEDNLSSAPMPLYVKMLKTMKIFTMLEDLVLQNIRLPVDYPAIIHAFPCLRNLQFISCEFMDDVPTSNALSTPPASLEGLVMVGTCYPEAILRCIRESRIDSQGSQFMAPLTLLVQGLNLQKLWVDEDTATMLTILLQPFPNNLQVLEVGTMASNRAFEINTSFRTGDLVDPLTLFRLLMLFPSITSFCGFAKDYLSSVSFQNLFPLWNPSALKFLHKYQGPCIIASFLVSQGRIPREIVLSAYGYQNFLSISTYTGCASIELSPSSRLENGFHSRASITRLVFNIARAFLYEYPGEIKHLSMDRPYSWSDSDDQDSQNFSFRAPSGDLVSLSGTSKNIFNIFKLLNVRPREITVFCEPQEERFEDICLALVHSQERLSGLEALCFKKTSSKYTQILEGILTLPYQIQRLEIDSRFDSLDGFTTYSRFLLEKFTNLVELRIYTPQDDNISWLASPINPELLSNNGFPILVDWSEFGPPLSPEEELKEILTVWHKLYPKLQVVQLAAWSVWKCGDDGLWVRIEE